MLAVLLSDKRNGQSLEARFPRRIRTITQSTCSIAEAFGSSSSQMFANVLKKTSIMRIPAAFISKFCLELLNMECAVEFLPSQTRWCRIIDN